MEKVPMTKREYLNGKVQEIMVIIKVREVQRRNTIFLEEISED